MKQGTSRALTTSEVRAEVEIAASQDDVWNALTTGIGEWWPSWFCCSAGEGTPRFLLEARPGGRFWEDWGDGDGLLWGTVVHVQQPKLLQLSGIAGPAWGGPNAWFGSFEIEAAGDGCRLRLSESTFGQIGEATAAEKAKGWNFLLETAKAHLEGTEPPQWRD